MKADYQFVVDCNVQVVLASDAQIENTTEEAKPMTEPTLTAAVVKEIIDSAIAEALAKVLPAIPAPAQTENIALPAEVIPAPAQAENLTLFGEVISVQAKPTNRYSLRRKIDNRGKAALAAVDAAYQSVVDYNEKQTKHSKKWYIGPRLLKDITGVNYNVVKRWFAEQEHIVTEHNERHNLIQTHNRHHGRNNTKITDVLTTEETE